jgi:N-methylhydantoinase B
MTDPRTGNEYVRTTFDYDGGAGAVAGYDGAAGPVAFGVCLRGNVEEMEVRFPWKLLKLEAVSNFMGAGQWRGGSGVDWRALNQGSVGRMATGSSDGDEMVPKGVLGGLDSPKARTFVQRGNELIRVKPHRMQQILPGDVVIKLSAGGAGVGPPHMREPASVEQDVRNGFITPEAAEQIYRVALDPQTLAVDEAKTAALRAGEAPEIEVYVDEESLKVDLRERT